MPKAKNAKADEALALYRQGFKLIEIARKLDLPEGTVRRWKSTYGWGERGNNERSDKANVRKRGGQPGNHNATGPPGNQHALKHGLFSRYLPQETMEILQITESSDPIDLLWMQIQIAFAAIIRAQNIAYVKDQNDKTVEKVEEKDGNVIGERWEVQHAWDKQAAFMTAQARAQSELRGLIKQYEALLEARGKADHPEWAARLEKIKAETAKLQTRDSEAQDDGVVIINDVGKTD